MPDTERAAFAEATAAKAAEAIKARANVLVVDDHALLRTGVANIINQEPDLQVVAEAANGVEAVDMFERHHPDVTLLDLRMPEMEGVEAVRQIRVRDPQAKVIILTTYDTDEDITRALKAGAKAYVLKDISAEALVTCIHDVLAGKTYLAPAAAAKLAEGVMHVHLTPRELTALRLMADGKSNKEIANELGISDRTVKTHLGHLFEKLGRQPGHATPVPRRTVARRGRVRPGLSRPASGPLKHRSRDCLYQGEHPHRGVAARSVHRTQLLDDHPRAIRVFRPPRYRQQ